MNPTSNLAKQGKAELERVGMYGEDADYGPPLADCVVATLETFATTYGHSGGSAALGADLLDRLLRGESL